MNIFTVAFIASALAGIVAAQRSVGTVNFLLSIFGLLAGLACYAAIGWLALRIVKLTPANASGKGNNTTLGWLSFLGIVASPVIAWFVVYLLAPLVARAIGA